MKGGTVTRVVTDEFDALIVCRCEEVTYRQITDGVQDGATSVAGLKKRTRICMGPCQGRVCQPIVQRILAELLGNPTGEVGASGARCPLRPIRLGQL